MVCIRQRIYIKMKHRLKPVYYTVTKAGLLLLILAVLCGTEIAECTSPGVLNSCEYFISNYSARTILDGWRVKDGGAFHLPGFGMRHHDRRQLIVDGGELW
jgi:hypothetical protein